MKTSLKRSEIIEHMKRMFGFQNVFTVLYESILDSGHFEKYYVLLFKRCLKKNAPVESEFQVLSIHLIYGWTEFEIFELTTLGKARDRYVDCIKNASSELYSNLVLPF